MLLPSTHGWVLPTGARGCGCLEPGASLAWATGWGRSRLRLPAGRGCSAAFGAAVFAGCLGHFPAQRALGAPLPGKQDPSLPPCMGMALVLFGLKLPYKKWI